MNKIPSSGFAAQTLFFKNQRKNLFNVGDLFENDRRAGPDLKDINKMNREELNIYLRASSAEAFGNSLQARWRISVDKNSYAGKPIMWAFKNHPGVAGRQLKIAGENYYNFILDFGPPIMGLIDKERQFKFEDLYFKIKIPEIRVTNRNGDYKIFIDSPSLWNFKTEIFENENDENKDDNKYSRAGFEDDFDDVLEKSKIVTLILYGFSRILKKYPLYGLKLEMPFELQQSLATDERKILPYIYFRHVNLLTSKISVTKRSDEDLPALSNLVNFYVNKVLRQEFDPNKRHCGSCIDNILGLNNRPICNERNKNQTLAVPKEYYDRNLFSIEREDENDKGKYIIHLEGKVDKNVTEKAGDSWRKTTVKKVVAMYDLEVFDNMHLGLKIISNYKSYIFGIRPSPKGPSFEVRMIDEADKLIQKLADETTKQIIHSFDFNKQFYYAGKKAAKNKLFSIGYCMSEGNVMMKYYHPKNT